MSALPSPNTPPKKLHHDAMPRCRNCGSTVAKAFCGHCGQSIRIRKQGLGIIFGTYLSNVFAADSRLFRSLIGLFLRPGALTEQNLQGRWITYLPPFRLYLFFSMVFAFVFFQNLDQQVIKFSDGAPSSAEVLAQPDAPAPTIEDLAVPTTPEAQIGEPQPGWFELHLFEPIRFKVKRQKGWTRWNVRSP